MFSNWEAKDIFPSGIFNSLFFLPDNVQHEKVNNVHFSPDQENRSRFHTNIEYINIY